MYPKQPAMNFLPVRGFAWSNYSFGYYVFLSRSSIFEVCEALNLSQRWYLSYDWGYVVSIRRISRVGMQRFLPQDSRSVIISIGHLLTSSFGGSIMLSLPSLGCRALQGRGTIRKYRSPPFPFPPSGGGGSSCLVEGRKTKLAQIFLHPPGPPLPPGGGGTPNPPPPLLDPGRTSLSGFKNEETICVGEANK